MVVKAAAYSVALGGCHNDFVVLSALLDRRDFSLTEPTKKDRQHLQAMVDTCCKNPTAMLVEQAEQNAERLDRAAGLTAAA